MRSSNAQYAEDGSMKICLHFLWIMVNCKPRDYLYRPNLNLDTLHESATVEEFRMIRSEVCALGTI